MNTVTLLGRLTKDPVPNTVQSANGTFETSRFTLAVNRRNGEQKADFISCSAGGKVAELVNKYLKKGNKVCVLGSIRTGSYTDKDGKTIYTTDVQVNQIDFADSKKENTEPTGPSLSLVPDNAIPNEPEFLNIPDNVDDEGLPFK